MSWTDKSAVKTIKELRDLYGIRTFVETGTFRGINASLHSRHFERVITCENNRESYLKSLKRLKDIDNVRVEFKDSKKFLTQIAKDREPKIFYLDAHFYNPYGPRWAVQDELRALEGVDNSVVIIHDFNNGLGHCVYEGERLGMNVVGDLLKRVNPNFSYYTNNLDSCDIVNTPQEIGFSRFDEEVLDNLEYAHKTPRLKYRGILYCTPTKLPDWFKLIEWNSIYKTE